MEAVPERAALRIAAIAASTTGNNSSPFHISTYSWKLPQQAKEPYDQRLTSESRTNECDTVKLPPLKSLSLQTQNSFLNPFSTYFTWWSIHHHFWKPNISSNMGQMSPALPTYPFWLQALPPPTLNEVHTLRTWWWNITWSKYEVIREKQKGKKLGISLDREGNMPALLPPSSMQVGSYRASAVLPGGGHGDTASLWALSSPIDAPDTLDLK